MIEFNPNAILIIICIFLLYTYITFSVYDQLLNGFYEADPGFCEEAGLDAFYLYINSDTNIWGARSCYILASKDDEIIINEPTTAHITSQCILSNFSSSLTKPRYYNIKFDSFDNESDIFPCEQNIRFYPNTGKMVLYTGDTITAVLYKSGVSSELEHIGAS
jgi:hypothetical protein